MKVNMTPNPLDVVTIHASQGDTEARQWEFELHNNGELIDTSEITEQMFFKSYKGGTEQLLPENTSTPTTSPFLGDIRYPQGLLTDQEFTYRQSPTESDGLAKITDVKGNTLNWNQISIVPFTEVKSGVTFTRSDDRTALQMSGTSTSTIYKPFSDMAMTTVGHVYYVDKGADSTLFQLYNDNGGISTETNNRRAIGRATAQKSWYFRIPNGTTIDVTAKPMIIDLTQMFGSGNEPTTVDEFTSLFSLSFYDYDAGSLLSFNGNGLKTTGKNLFNSEDVITGKYVNDTNGVFREQSNSVATNYIEIIPNTKYKIISAQINGMWGAWYDANKTFISGFMSYTTAKTSPSNAKYVAFTISYDGNNQDYANNVMLLFNGEDETFEPYTSTTTDLPISTYFQTGMKSVRSVYDELTPSKAITRIGAVDLGSLNWHYLASGSDFAPYFWVSFTDIKSVGNPSLFEANIMCSKYRTVKRSQEDFVNGTICADGTNTTLTQIQIKDSSYTDATAFKTAMDGVYLYYELATPTETLITTASLVTENAEIPLSNNDGVLIGKCTEQLSENPGFIDAKIKLSDSDGECYSNKIQLHVERSPQ